jgi:hypothetical protein
MTKKDLLKKPLKEFFEIKIERDFFLRKNNFLGIA